MALLARRNMRRVPRVGLLYSELVQGIPPMFPCLVDKIPSVHVVFVFMSIKNLPIPRVAPPERFIFRRVGPTKHRMFRRVARYGYTDQIEGTNEFSVFLIEGLKLFVHDEAAFSCEHTDNGGDNNNNDNDDARRVVQAAVAEDEKRFINAKVERGVVYLMSEAEVAAAPGASLKRIVVNYVYTFLRKNLSESHKALSIPKDQLLKVGITYEIY